MWSIRENNGLGDMTRQQTSTALKAIRGAMIASVVSISTGLILTVPADAQQRFQGSSGVVIDLSVLDGGGGRLPTGPTGQIAPSSSGGFAQFPPAQKPVSRLEGPLVSRSLTLTPPTSRTSLPTSRTASAAPVMAPAPTVAPQPPVVQKPAPVAAAPASPPAPKPTPAPAAATPPAPQAPAAPKVTPPPPPPAPTAKAAAETPPPPPAPTQTASRPSASAGDETRILFDAGSAILDDAAKAGLDALATLLKGEADIRVQLQAYAAGTDETAPDARRLSLSRALKVRSHLIDQGVRSTRMDVRALGVKAEGGPADRVDAVVVRR
jgi:outer membrane protein OmpA-like peptidoglycan-associated protein